MHGAPHQSEAEVLRAVLAGVPPERWAHAYTGNVNHKAAADVRRDVLVRFGVMAPTPAGQRQEPLTLALLSTAEEMLHDNLRIAVIESSGSDARSPALVCRRPEPDATHERASADAGLTSSE